MRGVDHSDRKDKDVLKDVQVRKHKSDKELSDKNQHWNKVQPDIFFLLAIIFPFYAILK